MSGPVNEWAGQYAVVKYEQAGIRNAMAYDTDYMVMDVTGPTKLAPVGCKDKDADGSKSKGFRVGRIVKVSTKGHLAKTYEIMIQVGNSGNQFKHMSIASKPMYECAINTLKTGKKVRIDYVEGYIHNPLTQDSAYNVLSINPLDDI